MIYQKEDIWTDSGSIFRDISKKGGMGGGVGWHRLKYGYKVKCNLIKWGLKIKCEGSLAGSVGRACHSWSRDHESKPHVGWRAYF